MCEERMQKDVKIISDVCIIMRMPINNTNNIILVVWYTCNYRFYTVEVV